MIILCECIGATAYRTVSSTFGGGSGPVFLTNLGCQGSESSLLNCSRSVFVGSYCTHGRDVGVKCERKAIPINFNHLFNELNQPYNISDDHYPLYQ